MTGLGRRIASNTEHATTETRYLWCGQALVKARTSADVVERRYYAEGEFLHWAPQPLLLSGPARFGERSPLRRRMAAASRNSITTVWHPHRAMKSDTDFRYARMFYLDGLYLTNYRAYNPESGQWLSQRSFRRNMRPTLYNYVCEHPIVWVDLSGLYPVVVVVFQMEANTCRRRL